MVNGQLMSVYALSSMRADPHRYKRTELTKIFKKKTKQNNNIRNKTEMKAKKKIRQQRM